MAGGRYDFSSLDKFMLRTKVSRVGDIISLTSLTSPFPGMKVIMDDAVQKNYNSLRESRNFDALI